MQVDGFENGGVVYKGGYYLKYRCGEKVPEDKPAQSIESIVFYGTYFPENKEHDCKKNQRVEHTPQYTEKRVLVTQLNRFYSKA